MRSAQRAEARRCGGGTRLWVPQRPPDAAQITLHATVYGAAS
jgi:hypothetical protein